MKNQNQDTVINVENQAEATETKSSGMKMMLGMAVCCGVPILGIVAIGSLGLQSAILDNLVYLACPIGMGVMMLFVMRGKKQGAGGASGMACCPPTTVKKESVEEVPVQITKTSTTS